MVNEAGQEKREFRGRAEFEAYFDAVRAVEGGTISPGGAMQLLRVSRQRVHKMIDEGLVRAWIYREDWMILRNQAAIVEISVRDLIEYGVRRGRISGIQDCRIAFPQLQGEIDRALELILTT